MIHQEPSIETGPNRFGSFLLDLPELVLTEEGAHVWLGYRANDLVIALFEGAGLSAAQASHYGPFDAFFVGELATALATGGKPAAGLDVMEQFEDVLSEAESWWRQNFSVEKMRSSMLWAARRGSEDLPYLTGVCATSGSIGLEPLLRAFLRGSRKQQRRTLYSRPTFDQCFDAVLCTSKRQPLGDPLKPWQS